MDIKEHKSVVLSQSKYDYINVKGSITILKNIFADRINLKGDLSGNCVIKCKNEIKIKGSVCCKSIETSDFSLHGRIQVESIVGKKIKIISSRKSKIGTIKAHEIEVLNGSNSEMNKKIMDKLLYKMKIDKIEYTINSDDYNFVISNIEGNTIKLENVQVDNIKCENIILIGRCNVKELIYSGEISIDEKSIVKNKERI